MAIRFNPDKDIPSLKDRVIFITGGTAGLGLGSVKALAKHEPARIFFSGRNQKSADAIMRDLAKTSPAVKITFIRCDISSLASVREAAASFKSQSDRLDILMLNAGIMAVDAAQSAEGYETQFATNHLGHALLVKLLLPILQETARKPGGDARVINMTSTAYALAPSGGVDFATLRSKQEDLGMAIPGHKWARYGQSKLAQMLYSQELAKHYPEITSVSIHPGVILTDLFGNIPLSTKLPVLIMSFGRRTPVEEGHYNQCWAATCEKSKLVNGQYYEPIGALGRRNTKNSKDQALAARVWDWTQKELESYDI